LALQFLDDIRRRTGLTQAAKDVDMILDTADRENRRPEIVADATQDAVHFVVNRTIGKEGMAVLGGKDDMDVNLCQGLGHCDLVTLVRLRVLLESNNPVGVEIPQAVGNPG
jgi:hypothetical protein